MGVLFPTLGFIFQCGGLISSRGVWKHVQILKKLCKIFIYSHDKVWVGFLHGNLISSSGIFDYQQGCLISSVRIWFLTGGLINSKTIYLLLEGLNYKSQTWFSQGCTDFNEESWGRAVPSLKKAQSNISWQCISC